MESVPHRRCHRWAAGPRHLNTTVPVAKRQNAAVPRKSMAAQERKMTSNVPVGAGEGTIHHAGRKTACGDCSCWYRATSHNWSRQDNNSVQSVQLLVPRAMPHTHGMQSIKSVLEPVLMTKRRNHSIRFLTAFCFDATPVVCHSHPVARLPRIRAPLNNPPSPENPVQQP